MIFRLKKCDSDSVWYFNNCLIFIVNNSEL